MAVRMIGCYSYMIYKLVEAFYLKIAMRQSIQNDPSNTLQYNTSTLQYNTSYSCIQQTRLYPPMLPITHQISSTTYNPSNDSPTYNLTIIMSQNNEQSIRCPFDPSHLMPYDRFLNHLDKCKFPQKHLYHKCKFNPYHVIHIDEIERHQNKCPDRMKYQPIEDDKDDWWGVQQEEKPQKSTVSTAVTQQSKNNTTKVVIAEQAKKYSQKKVQKGSVQIEDFDQADFQK